MVAADQLAVIPRYLRFPVWKQLMEVLCDCSSLLFGWLFKEDTPLGCNRSKSIILIDERRY